MITTAKVKEWFIEQGKRFLKVSQFGVKTAKVVAPFGDDANPTKDMTALFSESTENGETFIIGYVNTNQLAKVGEKRIYSTNANGDLSTFIWLKNDGTMEIGGNTHNATRYLPLENGIAAKDALINSNLSQISAALISLGVNYIPTNVETDITEAKNNEINIS